MRIRTVAVILVLASVVCPAHVTEAQTPIFTFKTDDFWLNLHHFLCALGLIEAKLPDASRDAIAPAAADQERGLARLDDNQRRTWAQVVTTYAGAWGSRNPAAENGIIRALAAADDQGVTSLAAVKIDPALRAALEQAAPIYRAAWWTTHQQGNREWQSQLEPLLAMYGDRVREQVTRAFGVQWPPAGRRIRMSAYTNFGGAYSLVNGGLILVASTDPNSRGLSSLEAVFHESLHQWDNETFGALGQHAKTLGVTVPQDLPHAMIFFTAGDAVRRLSSDYVPLVDRLGIWQLKLSGSPLPASRLQQPLLDTWKPYLDGRGTREDAMAALLARAAAVSSR